MCHRFGYPVSGVPRLLSPWYPTISQARSLVFRATKTASFVFLHTLYRTYYHKVNPIFQKKYKLFINNSGQKRTPDKLWGYEICICRMIISLITIKEVKMPYFRHFFIKLLFTCCVRWKAQDYCTQLVATLYLFFSNTFRLYKPKLSYSFIFREIKGYSSTLSIRKSNKSIIITPFSS